MVGLDTGRSFLKSELFLSFVPLSINCCSRFLLKVLKLFKVADVCTDQQNMHRDVCVLCRWGLKRAWSAEREQAVLSDNPVAPFSEELVLFVKLSLVLADRHVEAFLLKVGLLLLPDGGLLQHLPKMQTQTPVWDTAIPVHPGMAIIWVWKLWGHADRTDSLVSVQQVFAS